MGKVNHETSVTMQAIHIPRIVRLITDNPGLTVREIFKLRPFDFNISTLRVILVTAKKQGKLDFVRATKNPNKEIRWYVSNDLKEKPNGE